MQYLIKVFEPGRSVDFVPHLVTDEGDERSEASIWYWMRKATREQAEISVYRMTDELHRADQFSPILLVGEDGALDVAWFRDMQPDGSDLPPSTKAYLLEPVLDLS